MRLEPGESEPTTPLEVAALCRRRAERCRKCGYENYADAFELAAGTIEVMQTHLGRRGRWALPREPEPPLDGDAAKLWASRLGRLRGQKGGAARAAVLSPERRSEIARKAAETRWQKPAPSQAVKMPAARGALDPVSMTYQDGTLERDAVAGVPAPDAVRAVVLIQQRPKPSHTF